MADLVDNFEACDMLQIAASGHYADDQGEITPGFVPPQQVCLPKPKGISFTLTPAEFGLPALPLSLHVTGAAAGLSAGGNPLLRFSIDQDIRQYFAQPDLTVDHAKGSLTLELLNVADPMNQPHCGGDCHVPTVRFHTVSSLNNFIDINVHKTIAGIDYGDTLHVTKLLFGGVGSQGVNSSLAIRLLVDECGIGAVQGGIASFWAELKNAPQNLQLTYSWTVAGADVAPKTPSNQWRFHVVVPPSPSEFTVTLTVTIGSCVLASRISISGMDPQVAAEIEALCKLLMNIRMINPIFNPLGPDIRSPLSLADLGDIHEGAQRIASLTSSLISLRTGALGRFAF